MNSQQLDEITALQAIYSGCVTTATVTGCTELCIKFDSLDFGQQREIAVLDWDDNEEFEPDLAPVLPPPPSGVLAPPLPPKPAQKEGPKRNRYRGKKPHPRPHAVAVPPPAPIIALASPALSSPFTPPSPPASPISRERRRKKSIINVRYLPPLSLFIRLPPGYPETAPPFVELKDETGWFNESWMDEGLRDWISKVWQPEEEVLFTLIESLLTPSIFALLPTVTPLLLSSSTPSPFGLADRLKSHDRLSSSTAFSAENFSCGICLESKKGRKCVRLEECGDVFCAPCLSSYFTLLITEGLVSSVQCPSLSCVSSRKRLPGATAQSHPTKQGAVTRPELLAIVGPDLVARWERLVEKQWIEADPSIAFCPRKGCEAPVPRLEDEEKLRICPSCQYAFCQFCKKVWHGPTTPCALPQSSVIVSQYLDGSDEQRALLERKYGKANVVRLVAVFEEDRQNREYIELNSTKCPGCQISIEKSAGCSHMHCIRCNTHFCFRCGMNVSGFANPYDHWSKPSSTGCYNKLFDFLPGQEPGPAEWMHIIDP